MREATRVIEAFGEGVIWLAEIEKAFAGAQSSGQTDAGTSASMFGHFLTWMQETKAPVLVMATANNIGQLPPEFLRAGRFDAIFFVDLPTRDEQEEIIQIMNNRYGAELPVCSNTLTVIQGWTGDEIEQWSKDSLFDGIDEARKAIVPLFRTMREEITALREWAKTRARTANAAEQPPAELRRIRRV
jgi:SpoVK/Ycf46/Vps4 family AAA+-type ATPase